MMIHGRNNTASLHIELHDELVGLYCVERLRAAQVEDGPGCPAITRAKYDNKRRSRHPGFSFSTGKIFCKESIAEYVFCI